MGTDELNILEYRVDEAFVGVVKGDFTLFKERLAEWEADNLQPTAPERPATEDDLTLEEAMDAEDLIADKGMERNDAYRLVIEQKGGVEDKHDPQFKADMVKWEGRRWKFWQEMIVLNCVLLQDEEGRWIKVGVAQREGIRCNWDSLIKVLSAGADKLIDFIHDHSELTTRVLLKAGRELGIKWRGHYILEIKLGGDDGTMQPLWGLAVIAGRGVGRSGIEMKQLPIYEQAMILAGDMIEKRLRYFHEKYAKTAR